MEPWAHPYRSLKMLKEFVTTNTSIASISACSSTKISVGLSLMILSNSVPQNQTEEPESTRNRTPGSVPGPLFLE